MDRRALLQRAGALGVVALAGCGSRRTNATEPDDETPTTDGGETPTATPGSTERAVTAASVETVGSDCRSGEEQTATISFPGGEAVAFAGRLQASNPCHRVTIDAADYDAGADRLTVHLGTDAGTQSCIQCTGVLRFDGTVTFQGGLPTAVRIVRDGTALASADRSSGAAGGSAAIEGTSFAVLGRNAGADAHQVDVAFDSGAGRIRVRGTIEAESTCRTAELSHVEYDPAGDAVTLGVSTTDRPGAEGQACSQRVVGITYEATATFAEGIPNRASVVHNGDGVLTAAHGSSAGSDAADDGA